MMVAKIKKQKAQKGVLYKIVWNQLNLKVKNGKNHLKKND